MGGVSGSVSTKRPAAAAGSAEAALLQRSSRWDRIIVAVLWLALLAEGVFFAVVQPVWSRVDEAQHYHYVQYMTENAALPVEGETFVSPEVLGVSLATGQWGWRPAGALSTPPHLNPEEWITPPEGLEDPEREKWVRRNLWHFNYEAMQPPLYYAVNVPVYAALPDDPFVKIYGMRLLAALLASAVLPITYLMAREAFPDSRLVVFGAPVAALLVQGYALNMSQMTNDALAVPLAATAMLVLLRMIGRGLRWQTSALAGALVAASLLTKMTTMFLVPLLVLAPAMLVAYRRENIWRAARHCGIMAGAAAALMAPWLIHNLVVYGDATGASAARPLMSSFFWSPVIDPGTLRLSELLPTFWFGEPIFPFHYWTMAWIAVGPAMVIALGGVVYYLLGYDRRQVPDVHVKILFLAIAFAMGVTVTILIPFASGIGGVPGRYLYPLIPVGAFLLLFGIDRLFRRERARFVAEAMLVWMIVFESLNLLAYVKSL
jgi:4-amino-4-deoxy-L-arabinose transferase-like glycosyltransferase